MEIQVPSELDREQKLANAVEKVRQEEAHKRMLYDKSIGGPMVPRPSDEFVRQNVGELQSEKQIQQTAADRVAADERVERARIEDTRKIERSIEQHNSRLSHQSNREALRNNDRGEGRDAGSMRDRLRNQKEGYGLGRDD